MRLALLADIHGNLPALEAALGALEQLQPDAVIVNGDLINAVPFSTEVIDRIRAENWVVVRGNHEFYYLDFGTERAVPNAHDAERWGQLHWLIERIAPQHGNYLAMLPDERTLYLPGTQPLRVAHGVPGRNRVGFNNHQPDEKIVADVAAVTQRTLLSAHTHVQVDRHVRSGGDLRQALDLDPHGGAMADAHAAASPPRHWHVVNPGSIGLPLNGDPRAQFAVLDSVTEAEEAGGWKVMFQRVEYDRRPALEAFTHTGMLEAGGVISQLFYWELVTAKPEIIRFYSWAYENGVDPDQVSMTDLFRRYCAATGRDAHVAAQDPLRQ